MAFTRGRAPGRLGSTFGLLSLALGWGCSEVVPPGDPDPQHDPLGVAVDGLVCKTLVAPLTNVEDSSIVIDPLDPARAASNYGTNTDLWVGTAGTAQRFSLLKFDVSSVPTGSVVSSATLTVYKVHSLGPAVLTANDVTAPWTEQGVTYNSFGGAYQPLPVAWVDMAAAQPATPMTLDLTGLATRWVAGGANDGVLLDLTGGGRGAIASSEIGMQGRRPALTVCVTLPPPSCSDGYTNASETDVDCGGPSCGACAPGLSCLVGADCTSFICANGVCAAPSCSDGLQNGAETGVDCGGACFVPEVCNGLDEDCNGSIDDGNPGGGLACNTGELGVCAAGTTECQVGAVACLRDQDPTPEACNTLDDDCDGLVDEGCSGLTSWSALVGGSGTDGGRGVATDGAGDVYSVGFFGGTTTFGGVSVTAGGAADAYLVKTDAAGNHLWSKTWGGGGADNANAVVVDDAGDIYVTGWFQQSVDFGGGTLSSAGGNDIFLLKLSSAGQFVWAKKLGSTSQYDQGYSLDVDGAGNVLLGGSFGGTVNFGGGPVVSAGNADAFAAKFDSSGTYLSAQRWGGTLFDFAQRVAFGPTGEAVTCGHFMNTAKFTGGNVTSQGSYDMFLVALDGAGVSTWSKTYGNSQIQFGYGCDIAPNGNVVLAGAAQGNVDFGGGLLLGDPTNYDIALVELSPAGQLLSASLTGQDGVDEIAYGVTVDGADNLFATGQFGGTLDFGGGPMTAVGGTDAFAVRWDASRNLVFSRGFGTAAADLGLGLAATPSSGLLVTGYVTGTADYGVGALTTNAGSQDGFILYLLP